MGDKLKGWVGAYALVGITLDAQLHLWMFDARCLNSNRRETKRERERHTQTQDTHKDMNLGQKQKATPLPTPDLSHTCTKPPFSIERFPNYPAPKMLLVQRKWGFFHLLSVLFQLSTHWMCFRNRVKHDGTGEDPRLTRTAIWGSEKSRYSEQGLGAPGHTSIGARMLPGNPLQPILGFQGIHCVHAAAARTWSTRHRSTRDGQRKHPRGAPGNYFVHTTN